MALGDGKGGFAQQATVYRTGGANLFGLAVVALHRGGKSDVIAPSALASTLSSVLTNDGTGHFQAATGSAEAYFGGGSLNVPTVSEFVVVDLNGDGLPDLTVLRFPQYDPGNYTLSVMLQNANGIFAEPISSNFFPVTLRPP